MTSRPRYPVPWIASYFLTALALIAGSFFAVWYVNRLSSGFDYNDPDMAFLERIALSPEPGRGDFARLNGGDWQALCLVGAGGDLARALKRAQIPGEAAARIAQAHKEVAEQVEATEFALVYVDAKGGAKALRHPHGFAFARVGAAACTLRADPELELPIRK